MLTERRPEKHWLRLHLRNTFLPLPWKRPHSAMKLALRKGNSTTIKDAYWPRAQPARAPPIPDDAIAPHRFEDTPPTTDLLLVIQQAVSNSKREVDGQYPRSVSRSQPKGKAGAEGTRGVEYHKSQAIYLESKENTKISCVISSVGTNEVRYAAATEPLRAHWRHLRRNSIWVRKTSDSTKMRIYLGQLQRGAFVIRRRSAA
ncbi:hypothetical protein JZ751_023515 [Albula glossodonta]|uniref:Uncharacterized protein n=1 Tax=Albula glossodonta TaxID=121402 RepID=A0A8T2NHY5_9TELE|nr:hypothetical protein JZ751_023515 [Albula glossodonta]